MGLFACAGWILNFVQEIAGVSTDPQGSWSTKHILVRSFLIFEELVVLRKIKEKGCFGHETVCMCWMDLELCKRDSSCKYQPIRELVH